VRPLKRSLSEGDRTSGVPRQRPTVLSRSDGTAAVELAILMPVFLAFLLGIVEFGRLMWTHAALQFAVEAAAR
jgi:Flp pilus assembly protein TadG